MINAIDLFLKKLGPMYGIVFKLLIPAVLFYFPFKMLVLTSVIGFSMFGITVSYGHYVDIIVLVIYIVFVAMLIFLPKVASAIEFVVTPLYFVALKYEYLILFNVDFYSFDFSSQVYQINLHRMLVILIIVFILFKLLFFVFVKLNRKNIIKEKRKNI
ncbi:MAG: hypothetical protein Q4A12_03230 [Eubacteriales bacterium]|nr:hypothetical protein [Eubacteriales bacterium]